MYERRRSIILDVVIGVLLVRVILACADLACFMSTLLAISRPKLFLTLLVMPPFLLMTAVVWAICGSGCAEGFVLGSLFAISRWR